MTRIANGLQRLAEANATPFTRAVDAYGRKRGDARLGVGANMGDIKAYLKPRFSGGWLGVDDALVRLLEVASAEEMAVLCADPAIRRAIDEYRNSGREE